MKNVIQKSICSMVSADQFAVSKDTVLCHTVDCAAQVRLKQKGGAGM